MQFKVRVMFMTVVFRVVCKQMPTFVCVGFAHICQRNHTFDLGKLDLYHGTL